MIIILWNKHVFRNGQWSSTNLCKKGRRVLLTPATAILSGGYKRPLPPPSPQLLKAGK